MDIIPYGRQWIEDDDIAAVVAVLRGERVTQGPLVEVFEERMAVYCEVPFAVAFNSGTSALHGAIFAAQASSGDEVVTTPLSFVASANCVLYQGATTRFVDVEKEGGHMDPAGLLEALGPRTKAVIAVDFAGHPAALDEIGALARSRNALFIQDACHSLGAEYKGKKVGSQADMTVLSFHPVKTITTGEGGMVLTPRRDLADRLRRFRSHGIVRPIGEEAEKRGAWIYDMVDLGYNYRLTDLQCALGISQLSKLNRFLDRRRAIAARYDTIFSGLRHARVFSPKSGTVSAYHLYVLCIDFLSLGKTRQEVMRELNEQGVGSQVHYIPIHLQPYYRKRFGFSEGDFPEAERFYSQCLSLPIFPKMTEVEVDRVLGVVTRVIQ